MGTGKLKELKRLQKANESLRQAVSNLTLYMPCPETSM
jgi:hypothetical protein